MYKLHFKKSIKKDLKKIGEEKSIRILKAVKEKLLPDPRTGKLLTGYEGELWSFRVGDYRVLYNFDESQLIILVIRIGHRREVYKDKT
ncbi:MAG: type II toxin-antitoxin system RelE/ParE family toxin [bacterium]|nr:type II toxin-antitoxin system RelE/ParE family toxin [bacterium]